MIISQGFLSNLAGLSNKLIWRLEILKFNLFLKALSLTHRLKSGVRVEIKNMADWVLFNDIFVDGEYDAPLDLCFKRSGQRCCILDLGSNVGFFSRRALDLRRRNFPDKFLELTCVEGMRGSFTRLRNEFPILKRNERARFYHGLVGKKHGAARLKGHVFHAMTSLIQDEKRGGELIPFVDLSSVTRGWKCVDLLKCDIEGSEQLFIENYQDVLRRTNLAVFEFHLHRVDLRRCFSMLSACGLFPVSTLNCAKEVRLELFSRQSAGPRSGARKR